MSVLPRRRRTALALVLATGIAVGRSGRRRPGNARLVLLPLLAATALASVVVGTTAALLSDGITAGEIRVTGGTVLAPTAFTVTDDGSDVHAAWTAPATGLAPEQYDVFRRPSGGSYGGAATATVTAPEWLDTTATECETWFYKARARHTNLLSAFTAEDSLYLDRTAPATSDAHLFFQGPTKLVADHVRVSPGGDVVVYAEVADNCDAPADIDVSFAFGAPFSTTVIPTFSPTGWTPVGGGPTYHWRFDYALPAGSVSDGQAVTWNVLATDTAGNASTTAGTPFSGDGQGPTLTRAELVSAVTDYYDSATGIGEVNSRDTSVPAAIRNAGYHAYAELTDPSGVEAATVDTTALRTGATADPLTAGAYTAANGDSWGWRSADIVANRDRTDQTLYAFTVSSTDELGNTATSGDQNVLVDDTRPAAGNTSCQNFGSNDASLASPDYTLFRFQNTIVPSSVKAGWDGSTLTATAILRNGTRDYFDLNTDFGMNLFRGTAYNRGWNLNNNGWTTADRNFAGTTFGFADPQTFRLGYAGGATPTAPTANATAYFAATSLVEASGNTPSGNFTESCTTSPW